MNGIERLEENLHRGQIWSTATFSLNEHWYWPSNNTEMQFQRAVIGLSLVYLLQNAINSGYNISKPQTNGISLIYISEAFHIAVNDDLIHSEIGITWESRFFLRLKFIFGWWRNIFPWVKCIQFFIQSWRWCRTIDEKKCVQWASIC